MIHWPVILCRLTDKIKTFNTLQALGVSIHWTGIQAVIKPETEWNQSGHMLVLYVLIFQHQVL